MQAERINTSHQNVAVITAAVWRTLRREPNQTSRAAGSVSRTSANASSSVVCPLLLIKRAAQPMSGTSAGTPSCWRIFKRPALALSGRQTSPSTALCTAKTRFYRHPAELLK